MGNYGKALERDRIHREAVIRKREKQQGLAALLAEWESFEDLDHAYILALRARLRSVENQLQAMKP